MKETIPFQGRTKEAKNPHSWSTALRGSIALPRKLSSQSPHSSPTSVGMCDTASQRPTHGCHCGGLDVDGTQDSAG